MKLTPQLIARATGQRPSAAGYLRATVRPGKTLERLIASEQTLPNVPVVLTKVGQAAQRVGKDKVIPVTGPVDFTGTIRATGRSILFDCKECGEASFRCNTSAVKQHQIDELVRHGKAKALAGLLILDTGTGWLHWLDWTRLEARLPSYPWDSMPVIGDRSGVRWASWLGLTAGHQ